MSYNLLNFPDGGAVNRQDSMFDIFDYYQPDVLMVCELQSAAGADDILATLNSTSFNDYQRAAYVPNQSGTNNLQNMLYYRSNKLTLTSQDEIISDPRDINEYTLYYIESGSGDTIYIDFYMAHLKASDGSANEAKRRASINALQAHIDASGEERFRVFGGDMNFYRSSEDGYQDLLNMGIYKFQDPINMPGSWHNNSSFASIHTQSTRAVSFGSGSSGGMDDRFDFIFLSENIMSGTEAVGYYNGSYDAIGQDGNHYNLAINDGFNGSAPANVINSIYQSSDHLPVTLILSITPADSIGDTTTGPPVTGPGCGELFFSEYLEGSSNNKAFEVYNPSADTVDLTAYTVSAFNNGATTPTNSVTLSGSLAPGNTFNIVNSSADPALTSQADIFSGVTFINGDDAVALYRNDTLIDLIGIIGVDPGTNWPVGSGATSEYTLVRKAEILDGETDWAIGATEWDVYPQNTFTFYGSHTADPCDTAVVCDASMAPSGLNTSISGSGATLSWNAIPGAVGCQIQGRPLGAPSFSQLVVSTPPFEAFVPASVLNSGTTYEWKSRCACTLSPIVATPFSPLTTFTWPAAKMGAFDFELVPNPATDYVIVRDLPGDGIFELTDLAGKVWLSGIATTQVELALKEIPSGIYLFRYNSDSETLVKQLQVIK